MPYIDTQHLFKCETCRHFIDGRRCTSPINLRYGECYCPNLNKIPTADVVPREDYEAVIAGQETLQKYLAKIKVEVSREIFADIENVLNREYTEIEQRRARIKDHDALDGIDGELCGLDYALQLVTECKEKYTDAIDTNDDHK